jgi:Fanconi anemia group M protein
VQQQISACYDIMGIDLHDTAHLEGCCSADKRMPIWEDKRVFFCTPQTLSNDLNSGIITHKVANKIVLLVFDEAHRATGNYAYTTLIKELLDIHSNFRVLGLSATPGSDVRKVQSVITNLLISKLEVRFDDDVEIKPYTHLSQQEIVVCPRHNVSIGNMIKRKINILMEDHLDKLFKYQLVYDSNPDGMNMYLLNEAKRYY